MTVVYHVTLVDGTELVGTVHFSVGGSAPPSGASTPPSGAGGAAGSVHAHGVDPVSAALLALDGLVAVAVIVLLARRPRRGRVDGDVTRS